MHVIIEMEDAHNWPPMPGEGLSGPQVIPERQRPTIPQPNAEVAERECRRLAEANPGRRFVVFAPVFAGITVQVPSHTTLSGKVVGERALATVVHFREEDHDLPF